MQKGQLIVFMVGIIALGGIFWWSLNAQEENNTASAQEIPRTPGIISPYSSSEVEKSPYSTTQVLREQIDALKKNADDISQLFYEVFFAFNEKIINCPDCFSGKKNQKSNPPSLNVVASCESRPYSACIDFWGNGIDGCLWDDITEICYGFPSQ